ncbi:urease accessory protein UreF [Kovacikia minuta CCNUW1]|uniref:urease accessory protein UreF n=1 Tax=Kovacikia minuta TaxID=2931930 RepID=UPI001CCDEB51|nr:urease accessory protein UreF [Kovacikia minuta]UBF24657.1 urease accessory protein UreF [Kovacikia minuta CCNUW1]
MSNQSLLPLLQLANPTLPVGGYNYSEGIESLVETGKIYSLQTLEDWLVQELRFGAIRLEAAVMVRAHRLTQAEDLGGLRRWNWWLSAARETEELRSQSLQMGRSLLRLFLELQTNAPETRLIAPPESIAALEEECHFAIAFGMVSAHWQIELQSALLGYLHSWATNLVSAGVKLIPLGQTAGQQLIWNLQPGIEQAREEILTLQDDDLSSCSWGLALASMTHETQYSRLFRS